MLEKHEPFESLIELSTILLSEETLSSVLSRVASLSVRAIGACDGAGVSLVQEKEIVTFAGTDARVDVVDAIQYELSQGPCLQAIRDRHSFRVASMPAEKRWPDFIDRAAQVGVTGCLATPMVEEETTIGSLNLYAFGEDAFGSQDEESALLLAALAAGPVSNMRRYEAVQAVAAGLSQSLSSTVPEALGILMERNRCSRGEAEALLSARAAAEHRTREQIAVAVVHSVEARDLPA